MRKLLGWCAKHVQVERMKIVLVIPYNPLVEIGGLEIGTVRLATALKKFGCNVRILTKGKSGSIDDVHIEGKQDLKEICEWLIKNHEKFNVLHWMEIFPDLGEVNVQCMTSGLLCSFGKKVFLMVATSGNLKDRGSGEFITSLIKNTMNGYIISNFGQIIELKKYGIKDNIYPIGFGVDTEETFYPASLNEKTELRRKLNLPIDKMLFLFMGRFVERKKPDFLLKTWQNLDDIYDRASLVMVGSGMGQHDSIEKRVTKLAKECRNLIIRKISYDLEPSEYFRACDVLVLPSDREGQPNVMMEAMASGTPVIGSDIPGIVELLRDGENGLIFPVNNSKGLANAIRKLVHDSELRMALGTAARRLLCKKKSLNYIAKQYIALYKQAKLKEGDSDIA